jgi:hypothetical protein
LKGSYTIEAAVIMSICCFMMAGMIMHMYQICDEVTGKMVLHKTLEEMRHLQPEERKQKADIFRDFNIQLMEGADYMKGRAEAKRFDGRWRAEIEVKIFQPEGFLRKVEAARKLEERNGNTL